MKCMKCANTGVVERCGDQDAIEKSKAGTHQYVSKTIWREYKKSLLEPKAEEKPKKRVAKKTA